MSDLDQLKKRLSAAFEQPAQHDADGDTSGRDMFNLFRDAPNEDIVGGYNLLDTVATTHQCRNKLIL